MTSAAVLDCDINYDTRDGAIARRNLLLGLWAGRRMGLTGDDLENYALAVHLSDKRRAGHDDVIDKVASDLTVCRVPVTDRQLRARLREMELRASLDLNPIDYRAAWQAGAPKRPQKKPRRTFTSPQASH